MNEEKSKDEKIKEWINVKTRIPEIVIDCFITDGSRITVGRLLLDSRFQKCFWYDYY